MSRALLLLLIAMSFGNPPACRAQGTVAVEEAPPPLSPDEAAAEFQVAEGLEIQLVVAEPQVAQPLSISFDERGRMWVLQYRQFPNPNGLTPVKVDNWLRTKYDKIPEPPPHGPKGHDCIAIYEDTDGDGASDEVTYFLSDLNLASGMALGDGGVYVAQPPYLLFYPDRDRDDVPDGDPKVLLKGFGMDDAHAFANSLTWGPDGWLYGAQGSTATADIRGIGFQQGVWRYHPPTDRFELFAEGGGNTWGVDFDKFGNLFAAGNTVEPLVHHVQGAYYVKGFGKHGPLHNPHAYGYFQPVKHLGYVGDSLTGGYVLYQGGAFPERFNGACIAPNTRHSASRWSTIETLGSTFQTRAAGDFITTSDIWFRPVDSTVGPDGALYVADWYDYNISHSSPKNRSEWYQPSRDDGRVWRVAPPDVQPQQAGAIDLSGKSNDELIALLSHPNAWYSRHARRLLDERADPSVVPPLTRMLRDSDDNQPLALQCLWAIYVSGGFDESLAAKCLQSPHEYVRAWTVRLLGDECEIPSVLQSQLVELARDDPSVIVRSQLACTAKRLPAEQGIPIVARLLHHDEDVGDPHVPLLIWWAIEDKAISDTALVLQLFDSPDVWKLPLANQFILERLSRRLAAESTTDSFAACATLLEHAPGDGEVDLLLSGILKALSGRELEATPLPLQAPLARLLSRRSDDPSVIQLALRMGADATPALRFVTNPDNAVDQRSDTIRVLGETHTSAAVQTLLQLIQDSEPAAVQTAALSALAYFDDITIADAAIGVFPTLSATLQPQVIDLLCARLSWSERLLEAVDEKAIEAKAVSVDQVRQMLQHGDEKFQARVTDTWGQFQSATPLEKQGRISAVTQLLGRGEGEAARGQKLFEKTCATCHKLHGEGNEIGPDLTGAERKDRSKLIANIVDPSAVVRPQYIAHIALTDDGRVLTGLLAGSTDETVTLLDAKNKRTVLNRADVEELQESKVSLMPEKLLDELTDQQIRDLIRFIQSDRSASE